MLQEGKMVDASLVKAPVQQNSREENVRIMKVDLPEEWPVPEQSQRDVNATWTYKNGKYSFGYKNHIKVDSSSKLIDEFEVTTACVYNSQVLIERMDETGKGKPVWTESVCDSAEIRNDLKRRGLGCRIHKKRSVHVTLTPHQQAANRIKLRTRCRVAHIFASIKNRMRGTGVRCTGLVRTTAEITLQNLVYNMPGMHYLIQQSR